MQALGFDGYNIAITGEQETTLGINCGMSTGRNGVIISSCGFNHNQGSKALGIAFEKEKAPTLKQSAGAD